jgi:predicted mannosyl-3-phosphoglycerate phosphatase (HAD superfamily)
MKISLSIEFDLDKELKAFSDAELRDAFWTELLNYAVCSHLQDSLRWQLKAKDKKKNASEQTIANVHRLWADRLKIGKITTFKVER